MRERVLTALREKLGLWVSGEALGQELEVTRTTIWKQVKTLQSEGYMIETSPRKGYRLAALPDMLSGEEVKPALKTRVFARDHYFYFREIDSTNDYAKELATQDYPEGTVVLAEGQRAGRGRRGREWHSKECQGIYLSVILRPALPLKELSRVTLFITWAVVETLQGQFGLKPGIKWPNDILINGRKIAGILTEAAIDMDGIDYIVVGIGLNVNQLEQDFPEELRDRATSVQREIKRAVHRVGLLQELLLRLETGYQQLLAGDFEQILKKVRSLSLVIGHDIEVDGVNGAIQGKAIDIDDDGFLMLRDPQGEIHRIISGEVAFRGYHC